MKRIAFIFSLVFVVAIGMEAYTATAITNTVETSTVVDMNADADQCKEGCTCEKCTAKKEKATKGEKKKCCTKNHDCSKKKEKSEKE